MIELKNVSKFYNDNQIVTVGLRNVSLKLDKGEFVAITGDSGSGKSTLLNVISSIDGYDEGEILFYGNETFYFNQNDSDIFRKNNVSFIFQKYNIVDSYTVLQNVMLPLLIKGKSTEEAKSEALEIIKRVGLEGRAEHRGTKLSGGEKQRCVIARALATDAPILACDEPTGNLDSKTSKEIIKLIKEVAKDKLVLIVTHDYDSIKDVCTRKIKLSDGEVVEDITFQEGTEEKEHKLDLDNERPLQKTLFKLASLNVLSTPKKTVFTTLVFTFVSCIFLLLSLLMVRASFDWDYSYSQKYGIVSEDRVIIFDSDHASLDMDKLYEIIDGAQCYENAFYEESSTYIYMGENVAANAAVTFRDIECELVNGTTPTNADEFILVMQSYYYTPSYSDVIGSEINVTVIENDVYAVSVGKLVGVAISDKVNVPTLVGGAFNKNIANVMMNSKVKLYYSIEDRKDIKLALSYAEIEKSYIAVPSSLKDKIEFNFNLGSIYSVSYDVDVVYTDEVDEPVFFAGADYMTGALDPKLDGVKELTVYTENTKRLEKSAKALGYSVSIPSKMGDDGEVNLIVLYFLICVIAVALLIMFYISFAVIQRIYITKKKDYSIFRTLGVVSDDLKRVLHIEISSITLVSAILGGILAIVSSIICDMDLTKHLSVPLVIIYIITMIVFGILTAERLNRKIFKNSVYQSLREGGE